MLIQRIIYLLILGSAVLAVPATKIPTWKEKLEAKRVDVQKKLNEEFEAMRQGLTDKKTAFDTEKQEIKNAVDQLYQDAEKEFQEKLSKINEWQGKKPVSFALEVEGEPSIYETIRANYEAAKNTKKTELNTEIDKLFPGFKEAVDAYETEEMAKKKAREEKFDAFKQRAQTKMNETKQKFEQFASKANEKLKEDFELAKEEHELKKQKAVEVMGNLPGIIKNATGLLMNKIKEEKKVEAAAKLAAAEWMSEKIKNKTAEWKAKHPAEARSISDLSSFLNDASGASGWQTATTILMIICFIITIGLLILIFKQIRTKLPYERLEGSNIHPPAPHSLNSQSGYNPNYGNPTTFVPSREALRKQEYPQLF